MWVATVTVNSSSTTGTPATRKVDSEHSAAHKMYELLNRRRNERWARRQATPESSDEESDILLVTPIDEDQHIHLVPRIIQQAVQPRREASSEDGGFYDLFARRAREAQQQTRSQPQPQPQRIPGNPAIAAIQLERRFANDLFDSDLIEHLHLVVRGKSVEITNNPEYVSQDAPVVIYLVRGVSQIVSTLGRNSVKINVPLVAGRASFQAMMFLAACMELGADSCSVVGMPSGHINRVILS